MPVKNLLRRGVAWDGHPALVTGLFSDNETSVRINCSRPSRVFVCWKGSSVVEKVVSETPSATKITTRFASGVDWQEPSGLDWQEKAFEHNAFMTVSYTSTYSRRVSGDCKFCGSIRSKDGSL